MSTNDAIWIRPRPRLRSPIGLALVGLCAVLLGLWEIAQAAPARRARARTVQAPPTLPFDQPDGDTVVLAGAQIFVGNGVVIEDGVVQIEGSRIVAVGPAGTTAVPAEAAVVDLKGKRLTPGFIAASTAMGLVEIGLESSTVDAASPDPHPVRASYDAATAVNAQSSLIAVNAIEGITSAAVTPRGGLLSGQVAWIDMLAGDHQGILAKPRIAMAGSLGQTVGGSRAATLALLERVLDDAQFYQDKRSAHERRQTRDLEAHRLDLDALLPVLDGTAPLVVRADRASDLLALADLSQRRNIKVAAVGATQGWQVADVLAEANIPVVVQPTANLPSSFDRLGARLDNAARLHKAGVSVAIATLDGPHNVRNVSQEAGIAVAHGLPAPAALSAVTLEVARVYGMEEHYGSIEVGKVANLVVWDGDPFELSQWPAQVYIRGQAIPMRSRQTLLRDRYREPARLEKSAR